MKMTSVRPAGLLLEELLSQGCFTFSKQEFIHRLGRSAAACHMALHRLMKSGRLTMPRSGFYVIVDPQHRQAGTLPPEWFIPDLMRYLRRSYYVGLLSAAQIHGAAHHRPQQFQVVIERRTIRPVRSGKVSIQFHGKGRFDRSRIVDLKTPTGFMKVSSPETTAWDLVRYGKAAGGLENVITVLAELAGKLDATELHRTAKRHGEVLVSQRLGYLLERVRRRELARGLVGMVAAAPLRALDSARPLAGAVVDRKWRLIINADLESEA